jgi:hypothetical protein
MPTKVALVHTPEDFVIIRDNGYSGFPRAALWRIARYGVVVFTQNAHKVGVYDFSSPRPSAHRAAFAVGKVSAVLPTEYDGYVKILLSEVAALDPPIPDVWPTNDDGITPQRGTVSYQYRDASRTFVSYTLEGLKIDPAALNWVPVSQPAPAPAPTAAATQMPTAGDVVVDDAGNDDADGDDTGDDDIGNDNDADDEEYSAILSVFSVEQLVDELAERGFEVTLRRSLRTEVSPA